MLVVRGMYKTYVDRDRSGNGYFQYGHGLGYDCDKYKGTCLFSHFECFGERWHFDTGAHLIIVCFRADLMWFI